MAFQLPPLPFAPEALAPIISKETISFHYGKHHRGYVEKTNELAREEGHEGDSLEDLVRETNGSLRNNAAQAWNHTFLWHCLASDAPARRASLSLERAIADAFGDRRTFLARFAESAADNFGSGWTWLVKDDAGELSILNTSNADTPISGALVPLLVVDVWEHAYYLDCRNERKKYLDAIGDLLCWRFASERFDADDVFDATKLMRGRYAA